MLRLSIAHVMSGGHKLVAAGSGNGLGMAEKKTNKMGFDMTQATLKKLCREQRWYANCPELNEFLHLHQKGIVEIKSLEQYTGLKTLHLECNAISNIEGLNHLGNLRCLHLNQNLVEHVEGLENLKLLESLDLADNQIKCIKGLSCCPSLRQLNLSGNQIRLEEDVAHLSECNSLVSLDIARNRIDNEKALKVLRSLPLTLLKMSGNPIVTTTQHYRKMTVIYMSLLKYLDESPVSDNERRLAKAWLEGGFEEERLMREAIRKEEADQRDAHLRAFEEMIERVRAEVAAKEQEERNNAAFQDYCMEDLKEHREKDKEDSLVLETWPEVISPERDSTLEVSMPPVKYMKVVEEAASSIMELDDDPRSHQAANTSQHKMNDSAEVDYGMNCAVSQVDDRIRDEGLQHGTNNTSLVDEHLSREWSAEQLQCAEREKQFKRRLQERVLERAAAGANKANEVEVDDSKSQLARPMLWGTKLYKNLWVMAMNINNNVSKEDGTLAAKEENDAEDEQSPFHDCVQELPPISGNRGRGTRSFNRGTE